MRLGATSMLQALRAGRSLSAPQLNGLSVAIGVALVQAVFSLLFGVPIGLAAAGGAVCTSLPDVPNPPHRVGRRLMPAALVTALVTLAVGLCRPSPVATTLLVAAIGFGSLMAMAWGLRAGPLSFAGVLALVFAMAHPAHGSAAAVAVNAAWVLAGALTYTLWGRATAWLLQRRYGNLMLAAAIQACARRLRSRAARVAGEVLPEGNSIRASIRDDVQLADALQAARDHIFAAPPSAHSRQQIDLVLGLIELRDLLLASRLDLHLLGDDAAAQGWRSGMAVTLRQLADTLDALARFVEQGETMPQVMSAETWRRELAERLAAVPAPADDPRRHLMLALQSRLGNMLDDVAAMAARCVGPDRESVWTPAQLQLFVSPEGWPRAALKSHLTLRSGVMRHALRGALALSCAYVLGLHLPWASHPAWLVLSVAVVLRGTLDQTLSRRNERIIGTVIGCLLVLGLAYTGQRWLLSLSFLLAVGVAHAYVNLRYRVAAAAATLMALLQSLLLMPGSGPAVGERLADTFIGAMLAWAFCFVLPSWERRSLQLLGEQLRRALARHAGNVLIAVPTPAQQLAQRLSRQQAYTALAALAGAAQRTQVEPRHVRLPEPEIEGVLTHGYRLMALLGVVQQLLGRRASRLDMQLVAPALTDAAQACQQALHAVPQALGSEQHEIDPQTLADPVAGDVWPEFKGESDLTPWLLRRLRLCSREAGFLKEAEDRLLAAIRQAGS